MMQRASLDVRKRTGEKESPPQQPKPKQPDVPTLVRALTRQAIDDQAGRTTGRRTILGQRIIVDQRVDGFRCILIAEPTANDDAPPIVLSPREIEIARLISKGHPNKTIAAILEISTWTVGTYVRRIFAKLGVTCRAAMVSRLRELDGILDT